MAATRSPRYPNISLAEAVLKAKSIYQQEHMSPMTPPVAAEAMGYSGINGASLKVISSLKKYGLLEGRGEDIRLSSDAQSLILDDPESSEYKKTFNACALKPEVFMDLYQQFKVGGSERNIAVYLQKKGFKPNAANTVARHFRENIALISDSDAVKGDDVSFSNSESVGEEVVGQGGVAKDEESLERDEAGSRQRSLFGGQPEKPPLFIWEGKLHISEVVDLAGMEQFKKRLEIYESLLRLEHENLVSPEGTEPERE